MGLLDLIQENSNLFQFLDISSKKTLLLCCSEIFVPTFLYILRTKKWELYDRKLKFRNLTLSLQVLFKSATKCNLQNLHYIPKNELTKYLAIATHDGHLDSVKFLLQIGAPLHEFVVEKAFPIVQLAAQSQTYESWEQVQNKDYEWKLLYVVKPYLPILTAAWKGHTEIVSLFISLGDCPFVYTYRLEYTPLDFAVINGHHDIVQLLIKHKKQETTYTDEQLFALVTHLGKSMQNENNLLHSLSYLELQSDLCFNVPFDQPLSFSFKEAATLLINLFGENIASRNIEEKTVLHSIFDGKDNFCSKAKILLDLGASLDSWDDIGDTPLHCAASKGCLETVDLFLSLGCSPNTVIDAIKEFRNSPLHSAVKGGNLNVVKRLIEVGAKPSCRNADGHTPMDTAAFLGFLDIIEEMHKYCPYEFSQLYWASFNGQVNVLRSLLSSDMDIDGRIDHSTPLHVAATQGHFTAVEVLVSHGALVDSTDFNGHTPLYLAAILNHANIVEFLIQHGASLNPKHNGDTPLYVAIMNECMDAIEVLVKHGADIDQINEDSGATALIKLIRSSRSVQTCSRRRVLKIVLKLIELGANIDKIDTKRKETALHIAAHNSHFEVAEALVNAGADINIKDANGRTALHNATVRKYFQIVDILLERGADINSLTLNNETPLHFACGSSIPNLGVVKLLISKGANLEIETKDTGKTAIQLASSNEVVDLLLKAGAICKY